jgi:predicted nucleic acid-binding protein
LTTSRPLEPPIFDTTPVRHFALIGQFDLLVELVVGVVRVPRTVLDPEEDPDGIETLLSEIGQSARYWARRSNAEDAMEKWGRLNALRGTDDLEVVDLEGEQELQLFAELQTAAYARSLGLAAPLGAGEAAVISLANHRGLPAVIDDAGGRAAFADRIPGGSVLTSRDVLRAAAARGDLTSAEAELVYIDLLSGRYYGPEDLWGP